MPAASTLPDRALFEPNRTVVVQEDVCNGCGDRVPACPFGVIDQRDLPRSANDAPLTLPMLRKKEDGRVGSARSVTTG